MRSKTTVHETIKEKETEAKRLTKQTNLRTELREAAYQQLIKEEKAKLREKHKKMEN